MTTPADRPTDARREALVRVLNAAPTPAWERMAEAFGLAPYDWVDAGNGMSVRNASVERCADALLVSGAFHFAEPSEVHHRLTRALQETPSHIFQALRVVIGPSDDADAQALADALLSASPAVPPTSEPTLSGVAALREWRKYWANEHSDSITLSGKQADELCALLVDVAAVPREGEPDAWGVLCAGKVLTGVIRHDKESAQKWIDESAAVKHVCEPIPLYRAAPVPVGGTREAMDDTEFFTSFCADKLWDLSLEHFEKGKRPDYDRLTKLAVAFVGVVRRAALPVREGPSEDALPAGESPARDAVCDALIANLMFLGAVADAAGERTTIDLADREQVQSLTRLMTTRDPRGRDGELGNVNRTLWNAVRAALGGSDNGR